MSSLAHQTLGECPLLALSGPFEGARLTSAIGGEADTIDPYL
jgi:hypothetical protein